MNHHRVWLLFLFFLGAASFCLSNTEEEESSSSSLSSSEEAINTCASSGTETDGTCDNSSNANTDAKNTAVLVTMEELRRKNGDDDPEIWLSFMGKVYDVTAGKDFYGRGSSYGAFSATDCTVCFVSGIFSEEEAGKGPEDISDTLLPGVLDWADFYGTHDIYTLVGYLVDPRYYDANGEPTERLVALRKRISMLEKK